MRGVTSDALIRSSVQPRAANNDRCPDHVRAESKSERDFVVVAAVPAIGPGVLAVIVVVIVVFDYL